MMAIDRPVSPDRGNPSAEQRDRRADRVAAHPDDGRDARHRRETDTLTREEYADRMHSGPPIRGDRPPAHQGKDGPGNDGTDSPRPAETPRQPGEHHNGSTRTDHPPADRDRADHKEGVVVLVDGRDRSAATRSARADTGDAFPTAEDREHGRSVYLQWRTEIDKGREQGSNVIGEKPDASPGKLVEGRDPPTGEQLLETENDSKHSRWDALFREGEKEDALDGIHSEAESDASTWQQILEARPPEGHAEQVVPDSPHVTTPVPSGIEAGTLAASGLMLGVVIMELGRRVHAILDHRKEVT
jgi:hypothetical protein